MPRCREEERIIFPLGGFVAAALIRGTRAGKRDARARESTRKQKTRKRRRLDETTTKMTAVLMLAKWTNNRVESPRYAQCSRT